MARLGIALSFFAFLGTLVDEINDLLQKAVPVCDTDLTDAS